MDLNADAASVAARRIEMECVKPIGRKPGTQVDNRLEPHPTDDSTEKKKPEQDEHGFYETDEGSPDQDTGERVVSNDGEEHILDARA